MKITRRLRHSMLGLLLVSSALDAAYGDGPTLGASDTHISPLPLVATPPSDLAPATNPSNPITLPLSPSGPPPANDASHANPPGTYSLIPAPAATPSNDAAEAEEAYSQRDPDGIPLSILLQHKQPTQAEIDEYHRQLELLALNKNWLLRSYEHQQELHNAANGGDDQTSDIYTQISSNKALAKLAGLPDTDSDSAALKVGADPGTKDAALRKDPATQTTDNLPSVTNLSKPLISAWSPTESVSNFAAPMPLTMTSTYSGILPKPTDSSEISKAQEAADLDSPGMTAAKKDPTQDMSGADLTLDILPGESVTEAKAHQENYNNLPELPSVLDANQYHKSQATVLSVPTVNPVNDQAASTALPSLPTLPDNSFNAPTPVNKIPQINPVRPPIASPFDILNR